MENKGSKSTALLIQYAHLISEVGITTYNQDPSGFISPKEIELSNEFYNRKKEDQAGALIHEAGHHTSLTSTLR